MTKIIIRVVIVCIVCIVVGLGFQFAVLVIGNDARLYALAFLVHVVAVAIVNQIQKDNRETK